MTRRKLGRIVTLVLGILVAPLVGESQRPDTVPESVDPKPRRALIE